MKNTQVAGSKVIDASSCDTDPQQVKTLSSKVTTHCFASSVSNKDEIEVDRLQHLNLLKKRNKFFQTIIAFFGVSCYEF